MRERGHVEVAADLPVDSHEQVPVEGGGDAERIVVCEQQLAFLLHQIGADEQRVSRREAAADRLEERVRARRIEVADVRSKEKRQRAPVRRTAAAHRGQSRFVRRLMREDVDAAAVAQRPRGRRERGSRHIHEVDAHMAPRRRRVEDRRQLGAASRSKLHERGRLNALDQLAAMTLDEPLLCARDAVPRELADRLEQRRPERVVEVLRGQLTR